MFQISLTTFFLKLQELGGNTVFNDTLETLSSRSSSVSPNRYLLNLKTLACQQLESVELFTLLLA